MTLHPSRDGDHLFSFFFPLPFEFFRDLVLSHYCEDSKVKKKAERVGGPECTALCVNAQKLRVGVRAPTRCVCVCVCV